MPVKLSSQRLFIAVEVMKNAARSEENRAMWVVVPSVHPLDLVADDSHRDVLLALSHWSYIHSDGARVYVDFRRMLSILLSYNL